MKRVHRPLLLLMAATSMLVPAIGVASPDAGAQNLDDALSRVSQQTAKLVNEFSNVQCIERVEQQKLREDGKVETKWDSTYNYLLMLTNDGGDMELRESRIAVHEAKATRRNAPMLLSNGFSTLFLVFHPSYMASFRFSDAGTETINGHVFEKIHFEHITGMRSLAALALRGREYPLELAGTAWIEPETGAITRIEASVGDSLQDVGLKSLRSEIAFASTKFSSSGPTYWLPLITRVEVETPRQHWRNTHRFSDYKEFSVGTEESDKKVTSK